ncbi:hypothetical protein [Aminobacter aminovorans]|uniref:hypothetical protein n=1 Tax=Aminobacter aminovorans TaxID=83263 RepID=UPI00285F9C86|nr:hypothetical protein [Aminobacter aminovorans]MDR7225255.1 hypothetical protein [Aminobacter aminovorans]
MHIVLIATAWGPDLGGINAFNQAFAAGLAVVGAGSVKVSCAVTNWTVETSRKAGSAGVLLIPIAGDEETRPLRHCGVEVLDYLAAQNLPTEVDVWVGHDVISGEAAVEAAMTCGRAALIHHMDYFDYQNLKGGLGEKAAKSHKAQSELFARESAILFGVGSELADSAVRLSTRDTRACVLVPGFPTSFRKNTSPNASLRGIAAGRFDLAAEHLKQSRLAAAGFGLAVKQAADRMPAFDNASISFIGVERARLEEGELESIVCDQAGKMVNVVPSGFELDPEALVTQLSQSNLAIMPSYREGFGLAGWEAIGCEVPLVLGRETGLFKFIEAQLGGVGTGCVFGVTLTGGDRNETDVARVATAIGEIARDLPRARSNARRLKNQLIAAAGCTWANTAEQFLAHLTEVGIGRFQLAQQRDEPAALSSTSFASTHWDHFPMCAELGISAGQGSTLERFDLLTELRFGTAHLLVGKLEVEVFMRRAYLQVIPAGGKIVGERLGDPPNEVKGIEPRAGGLWVISAPAEGMMTHKALGDEVLCRIENPVNINAGATLELTTARSDIGCIFKTVPGKLDIQRSTSKVMQLFLQKSIVKEQSGHIVLSEANLSVE